MRRIVLVAAALAFGMNGALAQFDTWAVLSSEEDPFSGGEKVSIASMKTIRTGGVIMCDTSMSGFKFRVVPGYAYSSVLAGVMPEMEFAIDGKRLFGVTGDTGSIGDNLAVADADIPADLAMQFAEAFMAAKKQVAVKDGISTGPLLLRATGSTKAGKALLECLKKQSVEPAPSGASPSQDLPGPKGRGPA